jgi:hypothetical protein
MAEGHSMVARLSDAWLAGCNRFDRPDEALSGAYAGSRLVGVCGRNIDPYRGDPGARPFYVALGFRPLDEEVDEETATHVLAL